MKAIYKGKNNISSFTHGTEYTVLGKSQGLYRIIDNSGEDYLYLLDNAYWEIPDDQKGLETELITDSLYLDDIVAQILNSTYNRNFIGDNYNEAFLAFKQVSASGANNIYLKEKIFIPETEYFIPEKSTITGVVVIAQGKKIDDINRLMKTYKFKNPAIEDWKKVRGTVIVEKGSKRKKAEIHWYQCKNVGKVEFKIKKWYSEE
ncbi:hypothetical protein [Paenibacillus sp. LHD-38]|uniref:hypothetical protein n=1 Tax=Paenibacillus sp. LHD-38 TaxID=3072143 RepID=UPI00280F7D50|nr:hypothetical protein [Paenibacillus sp. LHD-38]MDQ8734252.1 hypothetical protein [Paenibacillus sp. LHD-38]